MLSPRSGDELEAHALLVRADPPVNAQLREPPSVLTLYFSEPLERDFSNVEVIDQDGERVDDGYEFLESDDAAMRVFLQPLEPGYVTVRWVTVSTIDGHRISGSYPLTILNEDGSVPAGQPAEAEASLAGEAPHPLRVVGKWIMLVAGSVLMGVFVFSFYLLPGLRGAQAEQARLRFGSLSARVAVVMLVLLAVAGFMELVLQASDIGASLSAALGTQWGERWIYRNLLLIPMVILVGAQLADPSHTRWSAFAGILSAAGYMVITSSVSHAAVGGGAFWAIASDFVHLLASSVWIGMLGLLILLFMWTRRHVEAGHRYPLIASSLQRFSIAAVISVALLMVTGVINTLVEIGQFSDLLTSGYGRALTLKLVLLVPLLFVGFYNAYLLRPDFVEAAGLNSNSRDRQNLLQSLEQQLYKRIRTEFVIALMVLAVVALLVQLTPTRGRLAPPPAPPGDFIATIDIENLQATLVVSPNQPGINRFEVYVAGAVDEVENLRLEFIQPDGFTSEARLSLDLMSPPSFYAGQGPYLYEPGNWTIILNIRRLTENDLRPVFNLNLEPEFTPEDAGRSGGALNTPIDINVTTIGLIAVALTLGAALVAGSVPRRGQPEGVLGWLAAEAAYRLAPFNVRPVWTLGALVAGGIALGIVLGNHSHLMNESEVSADNPIPATAESIERGRLLFLNNCAVCHGETGMGDGPAAAGLPLQPPNLYEHVPYHPDRYFFGAITLGLGGVMPGFESEIEEEDRWNIINFLRDTFTEAPADR